jgi:iron(III) transport system ATP-binding protein
LDLSVGEVFALLGPSGCGKSTTLRIVAGFERPDAGEVWIDDDLVATAPRPVNGGKPRWVPPERRRIGMVFQDYALFPHLTVAQNVAFGLRHVAAPDRGGRVSTLLTTVGLGEFATRYPHQLSGGQQQRVALARALAPRPRAILLDEPFNTLDANMRAQVRRDLLYILARERVAVLMVTHDRDEAFACASRVAVMRLGRIEQAGSPSTLYNRPVSQFVATFAGDGVFLPVEARAGSLAFPNEWPVASLTVADPAAWVHAGEVDLLVRPGEVDIDPDPFGDSVVGEGRPRGADVEYDVRPRTAPHGNLALRARVREWLAPGTPVRVALRLRHLVLLSGGRTVASACLTPACTCR